MNPFCIPFAITNMGGALLAMDLGFMGPNYSISTACATGNYCITRCACFMVPAASHVTACLLTSGFTRVFWARSWHTQSDAVRRGRMRRSQGGKLKRGHGGRCEMRAWPHAGMMYDVTMAAAVVSVGWTCYKSPSAPPTISSAARS